MATDSRSAGLTLTVCLRGCNAPGAVFEFHPHAVQVNRVLHHSVIDQNRRSRSP